MTVQIAQYCTFLLTESCLHGHPVLCKFSDPTRSVIVVLMDREGGTDATEGGYGGRIMPIHTRELEQHTFDMSSVPRIVIFDDS